MNEEFRRLVAEVGAFYLKERSIVRAQRAIEAALARDGGPTEPERAAYLAAVRRYFGEFAREARTHLKDVDKRLAHASQVQFNLTAERGVAHRRVEATQSVLDSLDQLLT